MPSPCVLSILLVKPSRSWVNADRPGLIRHAGRAERHREYVAAWNFPCQQPVSWLVHGPVVQGRVVQDLERVLQAVGLVLIEVGQLIVYLERVVWVNRGVVEPDFPGLPALHCTTRPRTVRLS